MTLDPRLLENFQEKTVWLPVLKMLWDGVDRKDLRNRKPVKGFLETRQGWGGQNESAPSGDILEVGPTGLHADLLEGSEKRGVSMRNKLYAAWAVGWLVACHFIRKHTRNRFSGKTMGSLWDVLNLRCLWNLLMEMARKELRIQMGITEDRSELKTYLWAVSPSKCCGFCLLPFDKY